MNKFKFIADEQLESKKRKLMSKPKAKAVHSPDKRHEYHPPSLVEIFDNTNNYAWKRTFAIALSGSVLLILGMLLVKLLN